MAPRKQRKQREEPTLPFDVTQEIDASLVDELRRTEPTLTPGDFDEVTLVLPDEPKRR
jgi:hypothetical protein